MSNEESSQPLSLSVNIKQSEPGAYSSNKAIASTSGVPVSSITEGASAATAVGSVHGNAPTSFKSSDAGGGTAPGLSPVVAGSGTGSVPKTVSMKLFASWEIEKTSSSCIPRLVTNNNGFFLPSMYSPTNQHFPSDHIQNCCSMYDSSLKSSLHHA